MLIDVISHNAAQQLLNRIEQSSGKNTSWGALHFAGAGLQQKINEEVLLLALRPIVSNRKATLYLFDDGDIMVTCHGGQNAVIEALRHVLYTHLKLPPEKALDCYFDSLAQAEELRLLCKHKLTGESAANSDCGFFTFEALSHQLATLSDNQLNDFRMAVKQRRQRKQLEILIVEDQPFSAKLLAGLLDRISKTYSAPDAKIAMGLYLIHAPDIVFLDIELPGVNGHGLAIALKQLDPDAYIIMVTANHYAEDVNRARENGAKGFVVKPYSKQKILEGVGQYIQEHKLNH